MAIKLDLAKAFDCIEWDFIKKILDFFGFPQHFTRLVMSCLNFSVLRVLINGRPSNPIIPSRGVRQGDPLSPYLFILAMEYLSLSITHLVSQGHWNPIHINSKAPRVSHLLFADDIILFARADYHNANLISSTLSEFSDLSGLRINFDKSRVLFSKNTPPSLADSLSSLLNIKPTLNLGTYLSIPLKSTKLHSRDLTFLLDKISNRINSWTNKFLTLAGRCTLIKSTLSALPTHIMQTASLPVGFLNKIDSINKNFL